MRISAILKTLIVMAIVALCAATAAAWLAALGWPFELFSHFRLQYLSVGALLAAAALLSGRRGYALTALIATTMNLVNLDGPAIVNAAPVDPGCTGSEFTVITANVEFTNRDHDSLLRWLRTQSADVMVLEEVTASWARSLEKFPGYGFRSIRPREDPYGLALLSRRPLQSVEWLDFTGDGVPTVSAMLEIGDQPLELIGMHTHSPTAPDRLRARDIELARVAERATYGGQPTVVLGDLNVSPDAPAFAALLENGRLRDTLAANGWRPTWRADFWPLALRLDHVLASPGFCVVSSGVGPDVGSDHRPVRVTLRLPRPRAGGA
jgi:endonuclease/exonuclease/phosphatase (EEP) superfamily protein YafD